MTCRLVVYVLQLPDGTLYVGSTAKPIVTRLKEHRARRGARCRLLGAVRRCGSRGEAERAEARIARELRGRGYVVGQG
jgi:predicted GIY-YIG superfamily endonuclease